MSQALALPTRRPVRRRRVRHTLLLAAASLSLAASTPTPMPAQSAGYLACVDIVGDWYDACSASATTLVGEAACLIVGVVGILACAALEAVQHVQPF